MDARPLASVNRVVAVEPDAGVLAGPSVAYVRVLTMPISASAELAQTYVNGMVFVVLYVQLLLIVRLPPVLDASLTNL